MKLGKYPIRTLTAIVVALQALLNVIVVMGLHLDGEQVAALNALFGAAANVVAFGYFGTGLVSPVGSTVDEGDPDPDPATPARPDLDVWEREPGEPNPSRRY